MAKNRSLSANGIDAIMHVLEAVSPFYGPVSTPSLNLDKKGSHTLTRF